MAVQDVDCGSETFSDSPLLPSCQISRLYVEGGLIYSNSSAIWLSYLDTMMVGGVKLACQDFQDRAGIAPRRQSHGGVGG